MVAIQSARCALAIYLAEPHKLYQWIHTKLRVTFKFVGGSNHAFIRIFLFRLDEATESGSFFYCAHFLAPDDKQKKTV